MYEHQGLQDVFFIMLYGSAAMMALLAAVYLVLRNGNALAPSIKSSHQLRCWAAAFLTAVAASHIWWYVLGIYWLTEDRLLRNIIAISLDRLTLVPLMMCILLRMLQDRHRSLRSIAAAMVPFAVIAVVSMVTHDKNYELYTECYSLLLCFFFLINYILALRHYGRWLRDNFADLEHKEVWQSMALFSFILVVYLVYTLTGGALFKLKVVETDDVVVNPDGISINEKTSSTVVTPENIGEMLQKYCINRKVYLLEDLTLTQLSEIIGTNRTYLSQYFALQKITYNAYINNLRIEHFVHLYNRAVQSGKPFTTRSLVYQCGFKSYSTFAFAFKQSKGQTLTEWTKGQRVE